MSEDVRRQIATLEIRSRVMSPSDHAHFVGAIHAAEALGYRVEIVTNRDTRYDLIDMLVAYASPSPPASRTPGRVGVGDGDEQREEKHR